MITEVKKRPYRTIAVGKPVSFFEELESTLGTSKAAYEYCNCSDATYFKHKRKAYEREGLYDALPKKTNGAPNRLMRNDGKLVIPANVQETMGVEMVDGVPTIRTTRIVTVVRDAGKLENPTDIMAFALDHPDLARAFLKK